MLALPTGRLYLKKYVEMIYGLYSIVNHRSSSIHAPQSLSLEVKLKWAEGGVLALVKPQGAQSL